jgi:CelD/BcsL family acetyltransferase involved in cellulose biosynthesis
MKPGLVCHALAIDHNCRCGHLEYDFLMGDAQYKRSLSTSASEMTWLRLRRRLLKYRVEDFGRAVKRAGRSTVLRHRSL